MEHWDGLKPPQGNLHWSGGAYLSTGTEDDWPTVEVTEEMADQLIEVLRRAEAPLLAVSGKESVEQVPGDSDAN